jgi:hypothetical protein
MRVEEIGYRSMFGAGFVPALGAMARILRGVEAFRS